MFFLRHESSASVAGGRWSQVKTCRLCTDGATPELTEMEIRRSSESQSRLSLKILARNVLLAKLRSVSATIRSSYLKTK